MIGGITASMKSVYPEAGAAFAVDGDTNTTAHSMCGGEDTWLELDLNGKYVLNTVKIMQTTYNDSLYRFRMDDTEVALTDTATGVRNVCGYMKIDDRAEQTYDIDCGGAVGDKLKLTVSSEEGDKYYQIPCIHVNEVQVFGTVSA